MSRIVFDPIIPAPWVALIGVLLAAATVRVYFSVGARLSGWRNTLLAACRLFTVALVLAALLQPSTREEVRVARDASVLLVGIDGTRSMRQTDGAKDGATRLQTAKDMVRDAGLLAPGSGDAAVKLLKFGESAEFIPPGTLGAMTADAPTTNFRRSVQVMLDSSQRGETAKALILFTDGHDLELTSPAKTAYEAHARRIPIYAVPLGAQGNVRDAALHITNYQPYCFVKQKSHITGSIRVIGCEHENLTVQLLRQNQVIKTAEINAGEQSELPVDFDVTESEPGQYEYEVRVVPLAHEADTRNNGALTFLNVIDQQISVLLLEGAPYWDTSFLSRSLFGNDKVALDAVFQYMPNRARSIRKTPGGGELKVPATRQEFERYDAVILGRGVDRILKHEGIVALNEYVRDHGGTVIFGRGKAYDPPDELDPVTWGDTADADVSLCAGRETGSLPVFRTLADNSPGGLDGMPRLLGARRIIDRKTLAAILADARDVNNGTELPAMIHRRYGRGQVLSVAVEGLWRWSFNAKTTATNNLFDRFWDQLLVWLVSGSDFAPSRAYSFRANTANLQLGEKISLRLAARDAGKSLPETPVTVYYEDKSIARTSLMPTPDNRAALHTDYLPEKPGRYRASATLPDGATQEVKWMVYEENPEEKEVATDVAFLKTLCENSGGSLLSPDELKSTVERLEKPAADLKPKVKTTSIWDRPWVFYLACFALAADWYLRRKWGLC